MSLNNSQVGAATAVTFANGTEIVDFFQNIIGEHYIDWFNANCADKENWEGKRLGSTDAVKASFLEIWDNIPQIFETSSINLLQFAALMSILTNEVGAELQPVTEISGRLGLAYTFNAIPGTKRSYNIAPNKLAGDLFFDDADYWNAHSNLSPSNATRARADLKTAWNGSSYPTAFSALLQPAAPTAFIQQADFFKFRGRGFIQTTWRSNYKELVHFVQSYDGANGTIQQYKAEWAEKDPDLVCTTSTNDDWDALFQHSELVVPCRAIGLHNVASGNYLTLAHDLATLTASTSVPGSFFRMGLKISGGQNYATLFSNRVVQLLSALDYLG